MQSVSNTYLNKSEMRRAVLQDLQKLTSDDKVHKSLKIQNHLHHLLKNEVGVWAAFMPLSSEPVIDWSAISKDIQWCFPTGEKDHLIFKKSVLNFQKNSLGFMEPADGEVVKTENIAGFIVPGLAFDKQGNRLGRGQGFYDRTLQNYTGSVIGVCFQTALKDLVPTEDHDFKCNFIITEDQSVITAGVKSWN